MWAITKIPQTGWLVNKSLFLTVLGPGKAKIKALEDLVSGENLLPGSEMTIFLLHSHVPAGLGSSLGPLL